MGKRGIEKSSSFWKTFCATITPGRSTTITVTTTCTMVSARTIATHTSESLGRTRREGKLAVHAQHFLDSDSGRLFERTIAESVREEVYEREAHVGNVDSSGRVQLGVSHCHTQLGEMRLGAKG
ncbi:hypothetical protein N7519_004686 [Penicillium mononematosum]|uniref:uncharacterized protein n=1 Tax=Penicillium mononematosum TaxID=268346 RepID=UPI002547E0DE|nr:uncharacterized protein N7519_004686 [Penicillium mononematosum]KAJ6189778.1 hypothetical protein N7519_004686 [Penicillium mononematosum]